MPYIKVTNNEVRLGGLILTPEQEGEGYFHYEGAIPDGGKFMWDDTNKVIYADLTDNKDSKVNEIKTAYENANQLDIAYLNTTFQADKNSQDTIVSVLSAGSVPTGFFWLDTANNQVPMTYVELQGLSGAILTRNQVNFVKYQSLKAQVNTATTQAELDVIMW